MLLDGLFQLNYKDTLSSVLDLKQYVNTTTANSATIDSADSEMAARDRCFIITSVSVRAQGGAAQRPLCWFLQYIDEVFVTPGISVLGNDFDRSAAVATPQGSHWSGQFIVRPGGLFRIRTLFDAGLNANQAIASVQYFNAPRGQMAFS